MTSDSLPLISVVIPCYNGEEFVGEAIESVFSQTYSNWELIVVDDGSDDDSRHVIKQFDCEQVTLVFHKENQGIAATMNSGVEHTNGEYITFLDQDDLWKEEKLEKSLQAAIETEKPALVQTGLIKKHESGSRIISKESYLDIADQALARDLFLRKKPFYSASTVMIHRYCLSKVDAFDNDLTRWADQEMWIRILSHPDLTSVCVSEPLVIKRSHSEQATKDSSEVIEDWKRLHDKIMDRHSYMRKYRNQHLSIIYQNESRNFWRNGKNKKAIGGFLKSLYYSPTNWKSLVELVLAGMGSQGWKIRNQISDIKSRIVTHS